MPQHRRHTESRFESAQEVLGQRNFRQQHQNLSLRTDRLGHGFEIAFGLARAGHPVKQEWSEATALNCRYENIRGRLLGFRQSWLGMFGPGARVGAIEIDHYRIKDPGTDHAAQHSFGHPGDMSEFANARLFADKRIHCRRALRGQALGLFA